MKSPLKGLLVEEIIKAEKLVAAKSTAAVAEAAAMALVAQLPYQNSNIRRVAFGKGLGL